MAEIVKTVRIETGNGERSVKSLKKEISDLRDALLNMDKGGEEWKKTAAELTKAQEDLNNVMRAGKEAADADSSSIAGMEAQYKSLYQTYRLLSDEQRKTAEGMSMQKQLSELSKNLNSVKKDAGNFKDNIGHYADDMMSAFGNLGISIGGLATPFKLATTAGTGLKGIFDLLAKHPFLVIATVLIGLFKKIGDAIKGNEELQMRMNKVMAAFKPIGDVMANILDKIASIAVSVAEGIAKVVTWVNNLFGATKKLSAAEQDLAQQENELIKQRREYNEQNAEDEARIANLQEQASLTDDIKEKEKLLTEAKQLQEKVNERNVALAQKEYDIIKKKNAITPSSTEDLNKESEAQIKLNNALEEGDKKVKKLNTSIKSASAAGAKAADDAKKQLDEILKRLDENSKTEEQKLKEKYEEELKILIKYHKDTTALEKEYQKNLAELQAQRNITIARYYDEAAQNFRDKFIKPSHNAFKADIDYQEGRVKEFKKFIEEELGGTYKDGVFTAADDKLWEFNEEILAQIKAINDEEEKNGYNPANDAKLEKLYEELEATKQLSVAAKQLNEIWGLNITAEVGSNNALRDINDKYEELNKNVKDSNDSLKEWESALKEQEYEVATFKKEMENQPFWELIYGEDDDYDKYAVKLGNVENEERKFLEHRAEMAEQAWFKVKDLGVDRESELNELGLTLNDRLEMEREYYEALAELREHNFQNLLMNQERRKELAEQERESIFEHIAAQNDAMNTIVDTYRTLLDAYKRDGEISNKEAKKKADTLKWLEGIQMAVAVGQIVADTASGWMQLNKSQAAEYVLNAETAAATGPAAAATKAALDAKTTVVHAIRKATLIANGVAAATAAVGKGIAAIKGLDKGSDDGGSGGGSSAAPQLIDSTPYSYTRELQTDVEREELLNTPIYVRVTDIDEAQEKVRQTSVMTTF